MMTILELKELIRPLNDEDKRTLQKMLAEESVDIMYRLDELIADIPVSQSAPTDFAKNHHRYIHGQVLND